MARTEIYCSTDIETDGPAPGLHSMLSFGTAAYTADGALLATYSANLVRLADAVEHPDTIAWWRTQPEAWAACRAEPRPPETVMPGYAAWLKALPGRPVFVGYPASFDFAFVNHYLHRFHGSNPFGFAALDIKSYAMAVLGESFTRTTRARMPAHWFADLPHTHVALDDAIEQGTLFCSLLAAGEPASPR
ncbi:hypothetical protein KBTX_01034 [wastewater metagenome]|uniref:3'-5' exoribonuclease Rv2179c-like domain-containing protein n=3 Tax=root TaxID=1 RepID=A0A5B8R7P2_9ZZZZ|nr:3'-5' exoribonuclease [Arhodomonas aquaeolei]MCS4503190.1 3'-5' exoribonuclease [Arhodomonas aquaeolei]QEA04726.1 hypothetical protein KBTEX_01034 [uncultured organism]